MSGGDAAAIRARSAAARGLLASGLLGSGNFVRLWAIGGLSNGMRWLETLAAALFTLQVTGSGLEVAVVTACRTLPLLLLGALAGVLSESVDRKRIVVAGLLVSACASGSVCALAAAGLARPWHVALAGFVSGMVWATEMSTRRRMAGEAAGPGLVSRAVALDSLTGSVTRMVGPVLGGAAFGALGLAGAYALSALAYLLSLGLAVGIRHEQARRLLSVARVPRDLAEGLSAARVRPVVAGVLGVTVAMNFFAYSYSALVAPIGRLHFHVGDTLVGALAAAEPFGALIGGLLLARLESVRRPPLVFMGGTAFFMLMLALMPLAPGFGIAVALLAVGGLGSALFSNMQTTLILTEAPPHLRSRLMGIVTVCIGTGPLGQLAQGAAAGWLGLMPAVELSALLGLVMVGGVAVLWRRAAQ